MTPPARQGSDPVRETYGRTEPRQRPVLFWRGASDSNEGMLLSGIIVSPAELAAATPAPSEDRLRTAIEAAMTAMGLEGNRPNSVYAAEIADRVLAARSPANVSESEPNDFEREHLSYPADPDRCWPDCPHVRFRSPAAAVTCELHHVHSKTEPCSAVIDRWDAAVSSTGDEGLRTWIMAAARWDENSPYTMALDRHLAALRAAAESRHVPDGLGDWTVDEEGRSNSSSEFERLVSEVERLIREDAHTLIAGRASQTASLIMAQLAHVHGLRPAADHTPESDR